VVLIGPCTNYHVKLCSPSTPYTKCHHPARCYTANGHDRNTGDEEHEEQQCFVVKGPAGSRSYRQEAFVAPTIAVCLTVSLGQFDWLDCGPGRISTDTPYCHYE
jgi:hypothetical protein